MPRPQRITPRSSMRSSGFWMGWESWHEGLSQCLTGRLPKGAREKEPDALAQRAKGHIDCTGSNGASQRNVRLSKTELWGRGLRPPWRGRLFRNLRIPDHEPADIRTRKQRACLPQAILCEEGPAHLSSIVRLYFLHVAPVVGWRSSFGSQGSLARRDLLGQLPAWCRLAVGTSLVSLRRGAVLLALAFRFRRPGRASGNLGGRRCDSARPRRTLRFMVFSARYSISGPGNVSHGGRQPRNGLSLGETEILARSPRVVREVVPAGVLVWAVSTSVADQPRDGLHDGTGSRHFSHECEPRNSDSPFRVSLRRLPGTVPELEVHRVCGRSQLLPLSVAATIPQPGFHRLGERISPEPLV